MDNKIIKCANNKSSLIKKISKLIFALLIISIVFSQSGCNKFDHRPDIEKIRMMTENVLSDGIAQLSQESADWKNIVRDMQSKLTNDL